MQFFLRSLAPLFFTLTVLGSGCGWRTGLDDYRDGAPPRLDAGPLPDGGGFDVPRRDTGSTCVSDFDCDDGLVCDGIESCAGGRCISGPPTSCDDGIPCTRDACSEPFGCVSEPDDLACGPGFRCDPFRGCVPGGGGCMSDLDCDDLDLCNGVERCLPGGTCAAGDPIACPIDPFDCTIESCDPMFGCVSVPDSSLCERGQICRVGEGCVRVPCMTDAECDDGEPCNGTETCRRNTCRAGMALSCDDGSDCTVDRCLPGSGCVSSVSPETCADRRDNDCNGLTDCEDPVCAMRPICGSCMPTAPLEVRCDDGRDDDCDGLTDCADAAECAPFPGCCMRTAGSELFCGDGRDDDCNGLTDCADPRCLGSVECGMCLRSEVDCFDGRDEDCDGAPDCVDTDCAGDPRCGGCVPTSMRELSCTDGRDDDCDGLFDCVDMDCVGRPDCACIPRSMTETFCRDGVDDDCDGLLDCRDPDCASRPFCGGSCTPTATNEIGVAACTNGRDDDCDTRTDCGDPDCAPFGGMSECCNGRDDNGDGNVDEFTCFCRSNDDCVGVGTLEQVCWSNTFSICAPDCRRVGSDRFCSMFLPDLPTCNRTTGECE